MEAGATRRREADSVCAVCEWSIPNGSNYDAAFLVQGYFSDRAAAEAYQKKHDSPPDMATLIDIKDSPIRIKKWLFEKFEDRQLFPRGCGQFFLKYFQRTLREQEISDELLKSFRKCEDLGDLWFLINRYTVLEA